MATLSKAEEYINTYYSQLKSELNARGLQVSKVGLIGFLLNILGFTQQDIKLYYDTLFREAFVATADKYENLVMHGSIFGYTPGLGKPAKLTGNISIDSAVIPISANTGVTITLENLKVKCDRFNYILDSKYILKNQNCQIIDENNNITSYPISTSNPSIPIQNFNQYDVEEFTYAVPFYVQNSYYGITIDLETSDQDIEVAGLEVSVQEKSQITVDGVVTEGPFIDYEWRLVNYASTSVDRHVFVQFLPNGRIFLELGSGVHGKYIPNTVVKVKVKTTYGSLGNISKQNLIPYDGILRIYDNDTSASYSISVTTGITVEVDYASMGQDPLQNLELRAAIIEFIRHRNNLMSENDFYDIVKFYFEDFELMFKKTHVMDNNIYCFIPVRTTYQYPARTRSISLKHSEFNPDNKCIIYQPSWQLENGKEYISPFLYVINFTLRQYDGYILKEYNSTYFSKIVTEYTPDTGDEIIALPLALYTYYNKVLDTTRIMVQSYETLTDYTFVISIPQLGIDNQCLNISTDNVVDFYYYDSANATGIIYGKFDVILKVYKSTQLYFTYYLYDYEICLNISDILALRTFDGFVVSYDTSSITGLSDTQREVIRKFQPDSYVLNIPVIELDQFSSNSEYYLQKQLDTLGSVAFQENRMISDDVQVRYINSDVILAQQLVASTRQELNFDIEFPMKLSITIYANNDYIKEYDVNTVNEKDSLIEELAQILFDKYTGTGVSFYRTQIVDIVHNRPWVKHVIVKLYDNKDVEIPDANFETLPQMDIIAKLDKLGAVSYCPYYFWWDLENIQVSINYE